MSQIQCNNQSVSVKHGIYFLHHWGSDEWWQDTWPLPRMQRWGPERVEYHQPCWLYLYSSHCLVLRSTHLQIMNILLGSQRCSFTRYVTVSKWPLAQARESGVSPDALSTVPVHVYECTEWLQQLMCHIRFLLLGSQWCLFIRYLTVPKWPLTQARESEISQALLAPVLVHVVFGNQATPFIWYNQ